VVSAPSEPGEDQGPRQWRVSVSLSVPLGMEVVDPPDPGELLPNRIGPISRVEAQSALIGGVPVTFSRSAHQLPELITGPQRETAQLDLTVEADDPNEALQARSSSCSTGSPLSFRCRFSSSA
jgi:hypothetical protein